MCCGGGGGWYDGWSWGSGEALATALQNVALDTHDTLLRVRARSWCGASAPAAASSSSAAAGIRGLGVGAGERSGPSNETNVDADTNEWGVCALSMAAEGCGGERRERWRRVLDKSEQMFKLETKTRQDKDGEKGVDVGRDM